MTDWAKELEEDLNWREAELATLKRALSVAASGPRERALLRALVAVLYAHYEGFCRFAWQTYLDAVSQDGKARKDVAECLARLSLKPRFDELRTKCSTQEVWDFCRVGFASAMQEPISFDVGLDSKDNLWPDVFREKSQLVGLPCSELEHNSSRMSSLVARRNDLAHGKKVAVPKLVDYLDYENAALLVMHEVAVEVMEAIQAL